MSIKKKKMPGVFKAAVQGRRGHLNTATATTRRLTRPLLQLSNKDFCNMFLFASGFVAQREVSYTN